MEELKADVIAAKTIGKEPNVLIGGIEELLQGTRESLRKKPPQKSSNHNSNVNSRGTNHDRRQMDGVYDSQRILRQQRSPSSDWSGPLRPDQSEKENSDVSSVKSDDVTKWMKEWMIDGWMQLPYRCYFNHLSSATYITWGVLFQVMPIIIRK